MSFSILLCLFLFNSSFPAVKDASRFYYLGKYKVETSENEALEKAFNDAVKQLILERFNNDIEFEETKKETLDDISLDSRIKLRLVGNDLEGLKIENREVVNGYAQVLISYPKEQTAAKISNNKIFIKSDVYPIIVTFFNRYSNVSYKVESQHNFIRLKEVWDYVTLSSTNDCQITRIIKDEKISSLRFNSKDCKIVTNNQNHSTTFHVYSNISPTKVYFIRAGKTAIVNNKYENSEYKSKGIFTLYEAIGNNGKIIRGYVDNDSIPSIIRLDF